MNRSKRGFSLLEVMIAMAVLAIGLLVMTPLVSMAISRGTHARKVTAAQQVAQDLLERLRAEIRYDGLLGDDQALVPDDAWKFDVLPHTPDLNAAGAGCQPDGHDDGVVYDYGPFVFAREEHQFTVCYDLHVVTATVPAVPAGSMEVRIRVLWRNVAGGWTTWSLSDFLVSGA